MLSLERYVTIYGVISVKSSWYYYHSRTSFKPHSLVRPDFESQYQHDGEVPLFSKYQIESQIESAFNVKSVCLAGGSLLSTLQKHYIDRYQSARATKLVISKNCTNTNLEAAEEIARQLRDLGGLVVIISLIWRLFVTNVKLKTVRDSVRLDRAEYKLSILASDYLRCLVNV